MGALLHDHTSLADGDDVGVHNGREAVGDGDGGAVLTCPVEGHLDELLALRVQRTGFERDREGGGGEGGKFLMDGQLAYGMLAFASSTTGYWVNMAQIEFVK